jgi:hypothetical protein
MKPKTTTSTKTPAPAATPKATPTAQELPTGTETAIKREQWNQLTRRMKDGKHLPKADWELYLSLTREFAENKLDGEDWWQLAKDAGAFGKDQVPRCSPAEKTFRVNLVAQWVMDGEQRGWMLNEAFKRWGVGHATLTAYMKEADAIIAKRGQASLSKHVGVALNRTDALYRMSMKTKNAQGVAASLENYRKITGIDKPVTQEIRMGNPDGSPIGRFVVPERDKDE